MSETMASLLNAVEEAARVAGSVALGHFSDRPAAERKADGSPVTIADRKAEVAAREWITARFPDDGIVGEEFGVAETGGARRWIIDPIDGTKSFVSGVPLWGTLIAVCERDIVLAGAVFCPAVNEMLVAALGEGCWLNGATARVSSVKTVADATVLTTSLHIRKDPERGAAFDRLAAGAYVSRTWGDCYGYLLVSTGRAEVMVDAIASDWDLAAVQRCVIEAGGVFTDWNGNATAFGRSAIATNAFVADEVRGMLR
jgi:histidinol-phosphatase